MARDRPRVAVKFVIAGGFGAGKTTLIGAVSEIPPLSTEEFLTEASAATDHLHGVEAKKTTTVTFDFGRITMDTGLEVLLFGAPGQERFRVFWNHLVQGAHGAVVLVDTRRLEDSFPVVDYFEGKQIPFIVAVNCFEGADRYPAAAVAQALRLTQRKVPVICCDARNRHSVLDALIQLATHIASARSVPAALDSRS